MGWLFSILLGAMLSSPAAAAVPLALTKEYAPPAPNMYTVLQYCFDAVIRYSFVAVFDAGSSGTRVHIYRPLAPAVSLSVAATVPEFAPNPSSKKVKPGLSSFAGKEEQVAAYMEPLSGFINEHIKQYGMESPSGASPSPASCLVIFGATAGLRSVPNAAPKLLEAAKSTISAAVPCTIGSFRVISGEEEGGYGWLSVQSLSKRLVGQTNAADGYWGVLEMGGASMQVTLPLQPPALSPTMSRFKAAFGLHSEMLYATASH